MLVFVLLSLIGAGLIARSVPPSTSYSPATLASAAAPVGAQSSSWYCTGGSGSAGGIASPTLYLVNSSHRAVRGTLTAFATSGRPVSSGLQVPAGGEVTASPDRLVHGAWIAGRVDLAGGGVAVSELVDGSSGWAEAPCASTTAAAWYFASGSTAQGNTLFVSLFNPTSTVAVVDLTFVTPQGEQTPDAFEGLVVAPGAVVVAGVAAYVQDQSSISTIVQARSGRVVAAELQERQTSGSSGVSLRLGAPVPAARWALPRTRDVSGGSAELVVFNPTTSTENVTVSMQLPSGPVAPYVRQLDPDSTWSLFTSRLIRIPLDTDYATSVVSSGGPGVVVDRIVQSSGSAPSPQWGSVSALPEAVTSVPSRTWVLPDPSLPATPSVTGAAIAGLDLQNPGPKAVVVSISRITRTGDRRLARVPLLRIPPRSFTVVEATAFRSTGHDPLVLHSDGPLAAMEDASPAGVPGAVALPVIPVSR